MIRFQSIESLRALMAYWVVVGHGLHLAGFAHDTDAPAFFSILLKLLTRASTAVNVFIMVSGFVIAHLLISKREAYWPYIQRRWFRIFPIFLFCLFLAIILRPLYLTAYTEFPWVHGFDMRVSRAQAENSSFWGHLFLHLTMLHGLFPDEIFPFSSSTFLAPAWSLSLEWQFYLLAPFIVGLMRSSASSGILLALLSLGICWLMLSLDTFNWRYPSFLLLAMPHFLIGIASRMVISRGELPIIYWAGIILFSIPFADILAVLVWAIFFPILLTEAGHFRIPSALNPIVRLLALNKVLFALGKWSYSTYLIHIPLFSIFVGGYVILIDDQLSQETSWVLIVLASLVTVPTSWALYTFVEKPFIKLGNRLCST